MMSQPHACYICYTVVLIAYIHYFPYYTSSIIIVYSYYIMCIVYIMLHAVGECCVFSCVQFVWL